MGLIRLTPAAGEQSMKEDVLVPSGCHNNVPKPGGLEEQKFDFSVLEVRSLKLRGRMACLVPSEGCKERRCWKLRPLPYR